MSDIKVIEPYHFGRPREHNLDDWAQKLVTWVHDAESVNLNAFCASYGIPPSYLSRWSKENETFCQAYEHAKAYLATRRERKLTANELHVKAYDLNATTYDYFLREERRNQAEFEAKLKADDSAKVDEQHAKKADAILAQLSDMQSKIDRNK